jgi:hypothetical protein
MAKRYTLVTDRTMRELHEVLGGRNRDRGRDSAGHIAYMLERGLLVRAWEMTAPELDSYGKGASRGRKRGADIVAQPKSTVECIADECPGILDQRLSAKDVYDTMRRYQSQLSCGGAYPRAQLILSD